ncbi:hypothetical protein [Fervidibacillus halotolerans]|uniref:Uncharacterized protein n=1 Tax=Fervidibacillus halotolerans TaxID=2980027 RepID=A0A9E8M2I8_9BACI|nr:hypothetical protein [Fervidibacillus halotolerans]WAA13391.1 hypothetical protein OE105_04565 [Fervidibacillus halotolerans]
MEAKEKVVIWYKDADNSIIANFFDAYRLFDDVYITLFQGSGEFAAIGTLKPSNLYKNCAEIDEIITTFTNRFDVDKLINKFNSLTAADLLRLIEAEGVEELW